MTLILGTHDEDRLSSAKPNAVILGFGGNDYLVGSGSTTTILFGMGGDDYLLGDYTPSLDGVGDDHLYGGVGDDYLSGQGGEDHLYGGRGDDVLKGGEGADILRGGKGRDTFFFALNEADGVDRLRDFRHGKDILKLGIGAGEQMSAAAFSTDVDFNEATGVLQYKGEIIAKLGPGVTLDHTDFLV